MGKDEPEITITVRELIERLESISPDKEVVFLAGANHGVFTFQGIRDCLHDNMIFLDLELVL